MRIIDQCQNCEAMTTRNAVLVVAMKKVIAVLHRTSVGHEGEHSWKCKHPVCVAAWKAIDHR